MSMYDELLQSAFGSQLLPRRDMPQEGAFLGSDYQQENSFSRLRRQLRPPKGYAPREEPF